MKTKRLLFFAGILILANTTITPLDYNKRYDETTFVISHNGQSYKPKPTFIKDTGKITISVQNQDRSLEQQFDDGIQGIKIPIFLHDKKLMICHGINESLIKEIQEMVKDKLRPLLTTSEKKEIKKTKVKKKKKSNWWQTAVAAVERAGQEVAQTGIDLAHELEKGADTAARKSLEGIVRTLFSSSVTDIYFNPDKAKNKPCSIDPSATELKNVLDVVKKHLDTNKKAIITIFLEDWSNNSNAIYNTFTQTGLAHYMYKKDENPWPTLNELLKTNKRLIVFSNKGSKYFNSESGLTWSTPFEYKSASALYNDTPSDSGPSKGKLIIFQNFVTNFTHGDKGAAKNANNKDNILRRVDKYKKEFTNFEKPNFLWVDFYEVPEKNGVFAAASALNTSYKPQTMNNAPSKLPSIPGRKSLVPVK